MLDKILQILNDIRAGVDWENEEDFIEKGLLDSFDMITLINDLNEAFDVSIGLEQLDPENFYCVGAIIGMLIDLGAII